MVFKAIISLVLSFCCASLYGQNFTVKGYLLDKATGKPIPSASLILKDRDNKVLAFKITDVKGYFNISTNKKVQDPYLEINHLGYKKVLYRIENTLTDQHISLEPSINLLDSIDIKSKPAIQRLGDTISYNVSKFSTGMDRSIGDVLKRMPGIEVAENGAIKFQGKAISNFYIDGDDLLDDRYTIGTKTIPHKMVEDVQIMQNHEPIKVLKDKYLNDAVALNLVIKDEAKLKMTGEMKIGAGLPKQYDGEVNSILFNKKFKILNVLQGNNVGNDLSSNFSGFNKSSVLANINMSTINSLLSAGPMGAPFIPKANYFMNNQVSLNANNLINLKNEWQVKSNIQGLIGKYHQEYEGQTIYLTESGNIIFNDEQATRVNNGIGSIRFTGTRNTKQQYINNQLVLEYEQESSRSAIINNEIGNKGRLEHSIKGFSNTLSYIPQLKNDHIFQLDWILNYGNKPQTLLLNPGVFPDILNQGVAYDQSLQHLEVPTWYSKSNIGYRIPNHPIKQYYLLGVELDKQHMNSSIELYQNGIPTDVQLDSVKNNMNWSRYRMSAEAQYEWTFKRLYLRMVLPVSLQYSGYQDPIYHIDESQYNWLVTPKFLAMYKVGVEDEFQFNYQRNNSFGNIENVYRGLMIRNYRSLSNNRSGINENKINSVALNYKISRTLKMLFINFGIDYSQTNSTNIISNTVSDNVTQTELVSQENEVRSLSANVGFDKYIFAWASSIKINGGSTITHYNQLFNNELLPFRQLKYNLSPNLEIKVWKGINVSYQGNFNWGVNKQMDSGTSFNRNSFGLNQSIGLPLYLWNSLNIRFSARHIFNQQQGFRDVNYTFLDGFIRYRIKKWDTDLELNLSNLANVKTFETYSNNANVETHDQYLLRGRMAILKAIFKFK